MVKALYSTGHGEIDLSKFLVKVGETVGEDKKKQDVKVSFVEYMKGAGVEIYELASKMTSLENMDALRDSSLLIIHKPNAKLGDDEKNIIQRYLGDGKPVLISLTEYGDAKADTNLNSLLRVIDAGVSFNSYSVYEGELKLKDHPITKGLQIKLYDEEDGKKVPISCTTLASTAPDGLEVLIETTQGKAIDRSKGRPKNIDIQPQPVAAIKKLREGTLALFGCDSPLSDNPEFFQRTISYLLEKPLRPVPLRISTAPAPEASKLEKVGRKILEGAMKRGVKVENLKDYDFMSMAPEDMVGIKPDTVRRYLLETPGFKLEELAEPDKEYLDSKATEALGYGFGSVPDLAALVTKYDMGIDEAKKVTSFVDQVSQATIQVDIGSLSEDELKKLDADTGRVLKFKRDNPKADLIRVAYSLGIGPLKVKKIESYLEKARSAPYTADSKDIEDPVNISNLTKIFKLREKKISLVDILTSLQIGPREAKRALYTYELMKTRLQPSEKEYPKMDSIALELCKEENIDELMEKEKLTVADVMKAMGYMKVQREKVVTANDLLVSGKLSKATKILFDMAKKYMETNKDIPTPEKLVYYDKGLDNFGTVADAFSLVKNDPEFGQTFFGMVKDILPDIEKTAQKEGKNLNDKIIEIISAEPVVCKDTGLMKLIEEVRKTEARG
jgi:hypothetical protein